MITYSIETKPYAAVLHIRSRTVGGKDPHHHPMTFAHLVAAFGIDRGVPGFASLPHVEQGSSDEYARVSIEVGDHALPRRQSILTPEERVIAMCDLLSDAAKATEALLKKGW